MKIIVYYYDGGEIEFIIPSDTLSIEFAKIAAAYGKVKKMEFK